MILKCSQSNHEISQQNERQRLGIGLIILRLFLKNSMKNDEADDGTELYFFNVGKGSVGSEFVRKTRGCWCQM